MEEHACLNIIHFLAVLSLQVGADQYVLIAMIIDDATSFNNTQSMNHRYVLINNTVEQLTPMIHEKPDEAK